MTDDTIELTDAEVDAQIEREAVTRHRERQARELMSRRAKDKAAAVEKIKRIRADGPGVTAIRAAAQSLPATFTAEELLVAAWKAHPRLFGLREYPQYPDMHRLQGRLRGTHGLEARGCLTKVAPNTYKLGPMWV